MNLWKTTIVLFVIGLLLSFSKMAKSETVTLTKDNHVFFSGKVDDASVAKAQIELADLSTDKSKHEVIYLVIDSPGGSVPAGNRLIDFANSLPQKIKPICLFCASMGYHMFQNLDERLVYSSSELMSHRVSIGGLGGQVPGEAVTRLNMIISTSNQMDQKVAKRIGVSVKDYQKLIYDELWLSGDEAVRINHADKVVKIKCSNDLIKSTTKQSFNTMFGSISAEFSKCPLISGPIELDLARATFRNKDEAQVELLRIKRRIMVEY